MPAETKTHMELVWARIAVLSERDAGRFRRGGLAPVVGAWDVNASPDSLRLSAEFQAALISICASAFSIDALYDLMPEVPAELCERWSKNRTGRAIRIFERLKTGFQIGSRTDSVQRSLVWLFDLRDRATHFRTEWLGLAQHPSGPLTAPILAEYCYENASAAVDLVVEIMEVMDVEEVSLLRTERTTQRVPWRLRDPEPQTS